jgi:hypothetical protein
MVLRQVSYVGILTNRWTMAYPVSSAQLIWLLDSCKQLLVTCGEQLRFFAGNLPGPDRNNWVKNSIPFSISGTNILFNLTESWIWLQDSSCDVVKWRIKIDCYRATLSFSDNKILLEIFFLKKNLVILLYKLIAVIDSSDTENNYFVCLCGVFMTTQVLVAWDFYENTSHWKHKIRICLVFLQGKWENYQQNKS